MRDREAGFTLIEMMVTVAVIAILAVIALPSFFSESRTTKARAEVQPLFNDMRVRLEQYLQENGTYPPAPPGEATLWPPTPGTTKRSILPFHSSWDPLKLKISGDDEIYCSYTWMTYDPPLPPPPPALPPPPPTPPVGPQATIFGFAAVVPPTSWYYLLAKCDMDGNGAPFSWYFTSSVNPSIERLNEGN